mmetsp:Transcript_16541/g.36005  ORF Transcript_16541/g.36005 Transcript_16541/m.36005 type:complete len:517 (+) Transcript_16541:420-1970(+)
MRMCAALLLRVLALPLLPAIVVVTAADDVCSCDGCPNTGQKNLVESEGIAPDEACPEGSYATLTALRSSSDTGIYSALTWNAESDLPVPYVYKQASLEDTKCYDVDQDVLPVIGNTQNINVTLQCSRFQEDEAVTSCDFNWDAEFGCVETGVLVEDAGVGGGLQIYSDTDDTIKCTDTQCLTPAECRSVPEYLSYVGGYDTSLEHDEIYPGLPELMLGISLGPGYDPRTDSSSSWFVPPRPGVMSARYREVSFILAETQDSKVNRAFEKVGARYGQPSWGINVDLSKYGKIADGTDHAAFGRTKAESYNEISAKNPNTRYSWFGDNGQGDVCAAQSMLESPTGDLMMAVFIHDVKPDSIQDCISPDGTPFTLDLPESDKVHYFTEHSEATEWALDRNFISCCSAANVYHSVNEWVDCRCDGGECPELPNGFSEQTTKAETLAYCEGVKDAQSSLLDAVKLCDPDGACPVPPKLPAVVEDCPPDTSSSALMDSSARITTAAARVGLVSALMGLLWMS